MADRPNILFICTDQQYAGAMSCAGNADLSTPGMDRIAETGTLFERAYCTHPLCAPARSSFVTGLMPHQTRVTRNGEYIDESLIPKTIGNVLRAGGYRAGLAGKWHVPGCDPEDCGLDHLCSNRDDVVPVASAEFMQGDEPFFIFASFINPHDICQVARNQTLPQGPIPQPDSMSACPGLPPNFAIPPFSPDALQWLRRVSPRIYPTLDWTDDQWRHFRHQYFRLAEKVDAEVERLLDAVDASGKADETIVIFTSDHGDGHGAHQWNQKTALWQEEIHIPMIVAAPGQSAHVDDTHLVSNGLDLLPTVADYADVEAPEGLDGLSLRPLVEGACETAWREQVVVETQINFGSGPGGPPYARALVSDQNKYSVFAMGRYREQLIDLAADPGEMVNLAVETKHGDTLGRCRDQLRAWCERTNDPAIRIIPD